MEMIAVDEKYFDQVTSILPLVLWTHAYVDLMLLPSEELVIFYHQVCLSQNNIHPRLNSLCSLSFFYFW